MEDITFHKNLSLFRRFFKRYVVALFDEGVLQEVRILRYLHNNSIMSIPKFHNKVVAYYTY